MSAPREQRGISLVRRTLEREGYSAFYFPSYKQDPRHRTALFYMTPGLHMAGMGTMGLNCCIITPEYGPRVFVNAIITNLDLPAGDAPHLFGIGLEESLVEAVAEAVGDPLLEGVFFR